MFELNLASLPNHILYLDGVQLSYIKVFVHIFNLWHSHKPCFITNGEFAKRTNLHVDTIRNAIQFFEKHGVLRREQKGTKRYLVQVTRVIETDSISVDNSTSSSLKVVQGSELDPPPYGVRPGGGSELDPHNNKYNNKYKKSFCETEEQKANRAVDNSKKHDWATPKPPTADVTKQSTSAGYQVETQAQSIRKYIEHMKELGRPISDAVKASLDKVLNKDGGYANAASS